MIKNAAVLQSLERKMMLSEHLSIKQRFEQIDALWEECITLNKKLLTEIVGPNDATIELARILNSCSKS